MAGHEAEHPTCNWVQAMEGNLDTSHISWLHQCERRRRHPRRRHRQARLPVQSRCRGSSGATTARRVSRSRTPGTASSTPASATTPNGHTHVRMSAYCFPYNTVIATVPLQRPGTACSCRSTTQHAGATASPPASTRRLPRRSAARNALRAEPVRARHAAEVGRNGIVPRRYTAENDYGIDREDAAQRHLLRRGGVRQPGPHGHRVDGPDLRPHPGAAGHHRQGDHPDAPAADGRGQERGRRR